MIMNSQTLPQFSVQIKYGFKRDLKSYLKQQFLFILNESIQFSSNICEHMATYILPPVITSTDTNMVSILQNLNFTSTQLLQPLVRIEQSRTQMAWMETKVTE